MISVVFTADLLTQGLKEMWIIIKVNNKVTYNQNSYTKLALCSLILIMYIFHAILLNNTKWTVASKTSKSLVILCIILPDTCRRSSNVIQQICYHIGPSVEKYQFRHPPDRPTALQVCPAIYQGQPPDRGQCCLIVLKELVSWGEMYPIIQFPELSATESMESHSSRLHPWHTFHLFCSIKETVRK